MRKFEYARITCDMNSSYNAYGNTSFGSAVIENGTDLQVPDAFNLVVRRMTEMGWALHTIYRKFNDNSPGVVTYWEREISEIDQWKQQHGG